MLLRRDLSALGHTTYGITSQLRDGELVRIRRGAYRDPDDLSPEAAHVQLVRASLAQTRVPAVASHVSAAVLHGLPVDRRRLGQAHLMRQGPSRSEGRGPVVRHTYPTVRATVAHGIPVTTLESTTTDLARTLPFRDAVAVTDAALRMGVARTDLVALLDEHPRRHGVHRASRVVEFADARSESAGESHGRAQIAQAGLPVPDLQLEVRDALGTMRSDYGWQERGVLGEFDGRLKYGRELQAGMDVDQTLVAERRRELRLERRGWCVVRLVWSDLANLAAVRAIVEEGFRRAARLR